MKFTFEVTIVPVAAVSVSSISVCAIARVVVGVTDSTAILQGYAIWGDYLYRLYGNHSFVKEVRVDRVEPITGARQWKLLPHAIPLAPPTLARARIIRD